MVTRRRLLQLLWSQSDLTNGEVYGLPLPSFSYNAHCIEESGRRHIINLMSQDPIHNIKKLVNVLTYPSRSLQFGPRFAVHMNHIRAMVTKFEVWQHGLHARDIDRRGYDAMNFRSAAKLLFRRVLECLDKMIACGDSNGHGEQMKGIRVYLGVVRAYTTSGIVRD